MMGHHSVKTTQIYAKITNQKENEDMKILSSRIENCYELPKDDVPEDFGKISIINKKNAISLYLRTTNFKYIQ
ncbi:hypothetical protein ACIXNM_20760 [Bacteroides fragilis]